MGGYKVESGTRQIEGEVWFLKKNVVYLILKEFDPVQQ